MIMRSRFFSCAVLGGSLCLAAAISAPAKAADASQAAAHGAHGAPDAAAVQHEYSIYDHGLQITNSDGERFKLSALKGAPVLMTMFFASCPGICPMMAQEMQLAEDKLTAEEKARLRVVMVSFDENDTPERLRTFAAAHNLDMKRWVIGKGTPAVNAHLADMLDIKYEKLPNGSFNHTGMVAMIEPNGVIGAKIPATSLDDPRFAASVKGLVNVGVSEGAR